MKGADSTIIGPSITYGDTDNKDHVGYVFQYTTFQMKFFLDYIDKHFVIL